MGDVDCGNKMVMKGNKKKNKCLSQIADAKQRKQVDTLGVLSIFCGFWSYLNRLNTGVGFTKGKIASLSKDDKKCVLRTSFPSNENTHRPTQPLCRHQFCRA